MRHIYSLLFLLMSLAANLSAELTSADFKSMDAFEYIEAVQNVSRLNVMLNNSIGDYARIKGYPQQDIKALDDSMMARADCLLHRDSNRVQISLYFHNIPGSITDSDLIEIREIFAHRINRIVMDFCREFIYKNITPASVKIIAKTAKYKKAESNMLFIWQNGEVSYSARYFDGLMGIELISTTIPNQSIWFGDTINFSVAPFFSYSDDSDLNDLTFSAYGLPAGFSIDPNTGVITGTNNYNNDEDVRYMFNVSVVALSSRWGGYCTTSFTLILNSEEF